jgi:type IV secretion system protein VirD4
MTAIVRALGTTTLVLVVVAAALLGPATPGAPRPPAAGRGPGRPTRRVPAFPALWMRRVGVRTPGAGSRPRHDEGARWATRRELRPLVAGAASGRLAVGTAHRHLLAVERGHSLLVVGPTQSGKTSGLAIPALLEWEGPVVAASVKSDLLRHTAGWRATRGTVWVYDPTEATGFPAASWSPLDSACTWEGARRTAQSLSEVARVAAGTFSDGEFWYALAAKLIAPLLQAAASSGRSMTDVVRWVDEHEEEAVVRALEAAGAANALRAARASWGRDERQRSAVYTTAETVLEAFADRTVAAASDPPTGGPRVEPAALLDGDHTLYLCAPAHDQRRLRPLLATIVGQVIEAAYERATALGRPIDRPLLVVLDEAANVAPLAELDVLASTAAGHGIQLVTVWQDLAQLNARYGAKAGSVVNNHRAKLFLSGIADVGTLEHASALVGEAFTPTEATTLDGRGGASTTTSPILRRLVPTDALRRLPPGQGVLVTGHLPPARLALRPFYDDAGLARRADTSPKGPTSLP